VRSRHSGRIAQSLFFETPTDIAKADVGSRWEWLEGIYNMQEISEKRYTLFLQFSSGSV